jgi:hypothetical protein
MKTDEKAFERAKRSCCGHYLTSEIFWKIYIMARLLTILKFGACQENKSLDMGFYEIARLISLSKNRPKCSPTFFFVEINA